MVEQMEATTNSGGNVPITGKAPSVPSKATNESDVKDDSLKPSKRDKSGKLHKSRNGHKSGSKPKKLKTSSPLRSQSESSMSSISMGYNESDLSSSSNSGDSSSSNEESFDHRCCQRRLHRRARYGKPSSHHRRRSEHSRYSKPRHPQLVPPPGTEIENFENSDSEDKSRRRKRGNRKEFKDVACQTSPLRKTSKPATAGTCSSSGSGSTVKPASHASIIETPGSSSKVEHKQDSTGSTGGSSANSKPKSSSSNVKSIVFSVSSKPNDPLKLKKDSTKTVDDEAKYSKPNDSGHNPKQPIVVSSSTAKPVDTSGSKTHVIPAALPAIPKLPVANSNDKVIAKAGASLLPPKSEIMQRSIRTRSRTRSRSRSRTRSRSHSSSDSRSRSHSRLRPRSRSKSRSPRNNRRRVTSPNSAIDRAMGSFRTGAPPITHVRLHIKGLSRQVTKEHVTEIFGSFGPLTAVDFPVELDENEGQGRGFAFVEYANPQDCARAIKNMDGGQIDNRRIVVSAFRPNKVRAAWRRRYSPVQSGIRQRSRSRSHNRNNFESRFRDRPRSQFRGQHRGHQARGYHF